MQTLPLAPTGPATAAHAEIQQSELDASVNFISEGDYPGTIEARFVRRSQEYFIAYLSSQTGCAKNCRFCHLTQTGQNKGVDVNVDGLLAQADQVLAHYDDCDEPANAVHYNFMARGEVFANRFVLAGADNLVDGLAERAIERGLVPSCKFSTIMPAEIADVEFTDIFWRTQPDIYYSLYSMDDSFRRRWLPKAIDPRLALEKLVRWQQSTRKLPVLHWAFIEGANDSVADVEAIIEAVNGIGLLCDFNIVAYNPYSDAQGREPAADVIARNAQLLAAGVPGCRVKMVGRVGYDVKASCGMFVAGHDARKPARDGEVPSQPSVVIGRQPH